MQVCISTKLRFSGFQNFEDYQFFVLTFEKKALPIYEFFGLTIKMWPSYFSNEPSNVTFSDHKLTKSDCPEHIFFEILIQQNG